MRETHAPGVVVNSRSWEEIIGAVRDGAVALTADGGEELLFFGLAGSEAAAARGAACC